MDEEMLAAVARFNEIMTKFDELAHVVIKGHLIIEETISRIIDLHVFHREHVQEAKLSFNAKMLMARSLCLRKNRLGEWDLIAAINSLRNELAHNLHTPKRDRKIATVREIYCREAVDLSELANLKEQPDHVVLHYACGHCVGFLSSFEKDAEALRSMLWTMDRTFNSDKEPFER
jgi:hypothetical protein